MRGTGSTHDACRGGKETAVKITVIGCAGSFAGPDSPASSYLVEAPFEGGTFRLLLDVGSGSFGALQRHVNPVLIDAISISHLHPDHCFDISGHYVFRKYHPSGQLPQIPVLAPEGADWHLSNAYGTTAPNGMTLPFNFLHHIDGQTTTLGPFTIESKLVSHPVPTFAVKISTADASLVYSGDTGPMDSLADFVRGTDAFLCEASFVESAENPPHLHLTGAEAGAIARDADVPLLLVTHIPSWTDRAEVQRDVESTFSGESVLVSQGDSFDI